MNVVTVQNSAGGGGSRDTQTKWFYNVSLCSRCLAGHSLLLIDLLTVSHSAWKSAPGKVLEESGE